MEPKNETVRETYSATKSVHNPSSNTTTTVTRTGYRDKNKTIISESTEVIYGDKDEAMALMELINREMEASRTK